MAGAESVVHHTHDVEPQGVCGGARALQGSVDHVSLCVLRAPCTGLPLVQGLAACRRCSAEHPVFPMSRLVTSLYHQHDMNTHAIMALAQGHDTPQKDPALMASARFQQAAHCAEHSLHSSKLGVALSARESNQSQTEVPAAA